METSLDPSTDDADAERDPLRAVVPFDVALDGLLTADDPGAEREWLRALSNATAADVASMQPRWNAAPPARRRAITAALKVLADDDFFVSFKGVFVALLQDPDPVVRATAIAGLWEATEPWLLDRYADLLATDEDPMVRGAAAEAIGPYIERSELGQLDRTRAADALSVLLAAARDDGGPTDVRAKAVASVGWSESDAAVAAIAAAIGANVPVLTSAALLAIGRSADARWRDEVLSFLEDALPAVQASAAFAAGQLGLKDAILPLARVAQDAPIAVRRAAIEALGEIGGYNATLALELLAETESDDDLLEAIDSATESASLDEVLVDLDLEGGDGGAKSGARTVGAAGGDDDILSWLEANADPADLDGWLDDIEDDEDEVDDDEDDVISLGRVLRRAEATAARARTPGEFESDDLEEAEIADVTEWDDEAEVDRDAWVWDEGDGAT